MNGGVVRLTLHPVKNTLKKSKSSSLLELKWFIVSTYIQQTVIQQKLERLMKYQQVKIKGIRKIEKNNSIGISVFGYENKKTSNLCIKKML